MFTGERVLSSATCTAAVFIAGRWWSGSALWPGWQEKQVPSLGCTSSRAGGEGSRVWSKSPVISPPSFLLLPCGGITWCRETTCSPHFATPSSPGAFLPRLPAKDQSTGGLPGSLWGSRSLLFLCPGGAQRTSLEALPLFAEGTGSPCSFFAGGCGRRGCCGSRWSLLEGLGASSPAGWGGGSPFTARLGEGSLASYMVSSQLSASMGLCCYSSN